MVECRKEKQILYTWYRLLFRGKQHTVFSWYKDEQPVSSNDRTFQLSQKKVLKWPTHFPSTLNQTPTVDLAPHVIMPAPGNKGFDLAYFEATEKLKRAKTSTTQVQCVIFFIIDLLLCIVKPVIVCVQCNSNPSSESATVLDKVIDNRNSTLKQFRPYFKKGKSLCFVLFLNTTIITECTGVLLDGLTLKEENLFFVVCAFRDDKGNQDTHKNLPPNTIVLDRGQLKKLYTPSLSCRPQFYMPGDDNE